VTAATVRVSNSCEAGSVCFLSQPKSDLSGFGWERERTEFAARLS